MVRARTKLLGGILLVIFGLICPHTQAAMPKVPAYLLATGISLTAPGNPDIDDDGFVGPIDLSILGDNWLLNVPSIDIAGTDGFLNLPDLAILSSRWLKSDIWGDDCADAIPINLYETDPNVYTYSGSTVGTTGTVAYSCSSGGENDVYFKFVPRETRTFDISLCGSSFDTVLSVYDSCGGAQIACNDDDKGNLCPLFQSFWSLDVTAGTTYLIRIAGYAGATGNYIIDIY